MLKFIFSIFTLLFTFQYAQAQILEPVKWSFSTEQISADEYNRR